MIHAKRTRRLVDPVLFQQMMSQRIYSRIGTAPGRGLRINIMVLGYQLFNYIFRHFVCHPDKKKIVAFGGTPLEGAVDGRSCSTADGHVIVREVRTAHLWKGSGRGVELVGRDVQIRWTLETGGCEWFRATITKERRGEVFAKYHDDASTKWVKFPDEGNIKLVEIGSSALEDFLSFQDVGKAGWGAIKQCGGADDLAVPTKLTAIYMLKVNKHTLRVKEVCQLVIDTVTVLSGTTIAFEQRTSRATGVLDTRRAP